MSIPATYLPDPALAEYILSYGILEIADGITETFVAPPLGLSGFIFQLHGAEGTMTAMIKGTNLLTHQFVATGQVTSTVSGRNIGKIKSLLIFFRPLGMYQLFGFNMSRLTNSSMDLLQFLGVEKGQSLMNKLNAIDDDNTYIKILNDFFKEQKPFLEDTVEVKKVLDFIHCNKGNVTINEIERNCYVHRRSAERHFQHKIGLSPKVYASIYRFKCLMNYLQKNPKTTWLELSSLTGYYDQPHMVRYFKEYLTVSPHQLVTLDVDFINYLLNRY